MNTYMVLGLVVGLVALVVGYFALTGGVAVQAIIMFGAAGATITICCILVIQKKIYPSIFKVVVRVYAERYGGMTIIEQTRGKIVKDKKGYEYLETPSGKRYKMVDRKYIMKGNDPYVDIFDTKIQQFPITLNYESVNGTETLKFKNKDEVDTFFSQVGSNCPVTFDTDNLEEVHKQIISENQRAWFADQVIPNIKEITKPPMNDKIQIAAIISLMSVVIVFVMGMALGPDFLAKTNEFWQKQYSALDARNAEMYKAFSQSPITIQCNGGTGTVVKPTPPPG